MDAEEPIGLLIGAVRRRIRQAVGSRARRYGLSTQQFWVLIAIGEHPGASLSELAAHLRMDNPTASRVIAILLARKLVDVRGDAADGRRARLHLHPPGLDLARTLQSTAAAVRAAVVQGLSPSEQSAVRAGLRKIIANMDRFQHDEHATAQPARRTRMVTPKTRPSADRRKQRTR